MLSKIKYSHVILKRKIIKFILICITDYQFNEKINFTEVDYVDTSVTLAEVIFEAIFFFLVNLKTHYLYLLKR